MANVMVIVFFIVVLIIPLITLVLSSLMKRWGLTINAANMTLNNYATVLFENSMMKRAFLNSLLYGTASAGAAVCIALIIVYFHRFMKTKGTGFLLSVASLPLSVPNIILAVGRGFRVDQSAAEAVRNEMDHYANLYGTVYSHLYQTAFRACAEYKPIA